jgi:hypothetical protein
MLGERKMGERERERQRRSAFRGGKGDLLWKQKRPTKVERTQGSYAGGERHGEDILGTERDREES